MKFFYKNSCLVEEERIMTTAKILTPYVADLNRVAEHGDYQAREGSLNLPFDKEMLRQVDRVKKQKVTKRLKYVVVIGIGGSNLGTKAVYDTLLGYRDLLEPNRFPKMIFADTVDSEFLDALQKFLEKSVKHPEEILVNLISKSGGTGETIANGEIIIAALTKRFKKRALQRLVVTSDYNSKLWKAAKETDLLCLSVPKEVGGRFSVFSAVGLFPLASCGIDIAALLRGAKEITNECLDSDPLKNPALLSAALLCLHYKDGKIINDNFFFHPELESLGKWYRQLMGESIGKEKDVDGKIVYAGITPTVSIGSTDLHSVGQLYLGGPRDKFTTFVWAEKSKSKSPLPKKEFFHDLIPEIKNKSAREIMDAILQGIQNAYLKHKLPFTQIGLADLSAHSLGEYLQFKMIEMMYVGKLLNVNTFDQPNVESYKIETKKVLSGA